MAANWELDPCILIYKLQKNRSMGWKTEFLLLDCVCTFMNILYTHKSLFYFQCKSHKSSQIMHTGPSNAVKFSKAAGAFWSRKGRVAGEEAEDPIGCVGRWRRGARTCRGSSFLPQRSLPVLDARRALKVRVLLTPITLCGRLQKD